MNPRSLSHLFLSAAFCMLAGPADALQVAGHVLNKVGEPISGAKVCIVAEPTKCVSSNGKGEFAINSSNAIRDIASARGAITLDWKNGSLSLHSPTSTVARMQWLAADGRRPLAIQDLNLESGRTILPLPAGLPNSGVIFLRLTTPDRSQAWKAVLAAGRPAEGSAFSKPRIAALSKATSIGALEASKAGYKNRIYEPLSDPETDAMIFLSAADDNGLVFDGTYAAKVIAIDRDKKTVITETVDFECDENDKILRDTVRDTTTYEIRDGKMYVWVKGECTGQIFTGASKDIVGAWNMTNLNGDLPADLKTGCVPDSSAVDESPFENFTAIYNISETAITGTVSAEICPADIYGPLILILFGDSTITVTKNTCQHVVLKNGKGESANLDFSKAKDSLNIAFKYKTTTCEGYQDFSLSHKEPVCPEENTLMGTVLCMAGSGFVDTVGGPIGKTSAATLPVSREPFTAWKALPMSRDPFRASLSIFPWHGAR